MSIPVTLANALSGLTASSRAAEIVSSNTANVMTEGYARRELQLGARIVGGEGGGVTVMGVARVVNEAVLQDRRLADAARANATERTAFYTKMEDWLGTPEEAASLSSRLTALEAALTEAAARPEAEARLTAVLDAARSITDHLNTMSDQIQQKRLQADRQIAAQVDSLNGSLRQIDDLNEMIISQSIAGHDISALLDHRQGLVDQVSGIVPVRQVARENNQIALFTTGGAVLLESNPPEIEFETANMITADMTLKSGALSGLTLNGMPITTSDDRLMGGGTLGALFAIRDELAPEAQGQIDAYARNLIERFADPSVDPTLSSGDPGLFADAGHALDVKNEVGLAGRISINAMADPDKGGEVWRLRAGLGARTAGLTADSALLNALTEVLAEKTVPASGNFSTNKQSAADLASELLSQSSLKRQTAETTESFTSAHYETLNKMVLSDGVDTDQELQTLLIVERAFAANAKVMQTADTLLQQLLEM